MMNERLFTRKDTRAIYRSVAYTEDYSTLRDKLIVIYKQNGYDNAQDSLDLAERTIEAVSQYHLYLDIVNEDKDNGREKALQKLYDDLSDLPEETRVDILDRAIFGLKESGSFDRSYNAAEDYMANYEGRKHYCSDNEQELKTRLAETIKGLNLSEKQVKRWAKELCDSSDVVVTSAAFGRESFEFKCFCAARLFCKKGDNENMTVEEAAVSACTTIELQAVADAVHRGQLTAKAARQILLGILIAAGLAGIIFLTLGCSMIVFSLILSLGTDSVLAGVVTMLWGGLFMTLAENNYDLLKDKGENELGALSAGMTFVQKDAQNVKDGIDKIFDTSGYTNGTYNAEYDGLDEESNMLSGENFDTVPDNA